jgi:hypothetical protein
MRGEGIAGGKVHAVNFAVKCIKGGEDRMGGALRCCHIAGFGA